jgi:hypothetical protein
MGKSGGCQVVGYSYFLDMAYAFCDYTDHILGFYLQENNVVSLNLSNNGQTFTTPTGIKSELGGSLGADAVVTYYSGTQTTSDPYLELKSGKALAYHNVCYLVFKQAFIGDNVRTVPTYGVLLERTGILSASSLPNYATYSKIMGTKVISSFSYTQSSSSTGSIPLAELQSSVGWLSQRARVVGNELLVDIATANPAYIIYDILVTLLKVNPSLIDTTSFSTAAETLYNEKLGINIVLSSSKKGVDWINEILRYASGIVYFNTNIGKYTIKLFRSDYISSDLLEVSIDNANSIEFERPSRANLPNTFTIKYANITGTGVPKKDSLTLTNYANLTIAGFIKNMEVDFTCVNTDEALEYLASLYFKKLSYPLATIKFKINILDAMYLQIGETFSFYHETLTSTGSIIFRVLKVTGDSSKEPYLTIEAIEDIFHVGEVVSIHNSVSLVLPPLLSLYQPPDKMKFFDCTPESGTYRGVYVATHYTNPPGSVIRNLVAVEPNQSQITFQSWGYGEVINIQNYSDESVDYDLIITITDPYESLQEILGTSADLQRNVYTAYWGNEGISYKTCILVDVGVYEIKGIIRGAMGSKTAHSIGEEFWVTPVSANQLRPLPIVSITPTISVYAENSVGTSPSISSTYTYNYSLETPYPPNSLRVTPMVGYANLLWSPCVRLAGANYRNCDTIVAGHDEGVVEGSFKIYKDNVYVTTIIPKTSDTFISYQVTQTGTWAISTVVGSFESVKVTSVVSSGDIL